MRMQNETRRTNQVEVKLQNQDISIVSTETEQRRKCIGAIDEDWTMKY